MSHKQAAKESDFLARKLNLDRMDRQQLAEYLVSFRHGSASCSDTIIVGAEQFGAADSVPRIVRFRPLVINTDKISKQKSNHFGEIHLSIFKDHLLFWLNAEYMNIGYGKMQMLLQMRSPTKGLFSWPMFGNRMHSAVVIMKTKCSYIFLKMHL